MNELQEMVKVIVVQKLEMMGFGQEPEPSPEEVPSEPTGEESA